LLPSPRKEAENGGKKSSLRGAPFRLPRREKMAARRVVFEVLRSASHAAKGGEADGLHQSPNPSTRTIQSD
jgi:hypothetical protein